MVPATKRLSAHRGTRVEPPVAVWELCVTSGHRRLFEPPLLALLVALQLRL
jgi:hypothetical protein